MHSRAKSANEEKSCCPLLKNLLGKFSVDFYVFLCIRKSFIVDLMEIYHGGNFQSFYCEPSSGRRVLLDRRLFVFNEERLPTTCNSLLSIDPRTYIPTQKERQS